MALKIRLSRTGARNKPLYRVVVTPARSKRDGKFVEILGFYNPRLDPPQVKIDQTRLDYWISCGAQLSEAVRKIIKS